jgi:hypothetical protein
LKELNTAKLLSSKPLISGLEIGIQCLLNSENEQLTLESLWRPVLTSSAGERPSAIYITFFPARNILEQKMQELSNM